MLFTVSCNNFSNAVHTQKKNAIGVFTLENKKTKNPSRPFEQLVHQVFIILNDVLLFLVFNVTQSGFGVFVCALSDL